MNQFIQQIKNDLNTYKKKIRRFGDAESIFHELTRAVEEAEKSKSDMALGELCSNAINRLTKLKAGPELVELLYTTLTAVRTGTIRTYNFVISNAHQEKIIKDKDAQLLSVAEQLTKTGNELNQVTKQKSEEIEKLKDEKTREVNKLEQEKQYYENMLSEEKRKSEDLVKEKSSLVIKAERQVALLEKANQQQKTEFEIKIAEKMNDLQLKEESICQKERELTIAQTKIGENAQLIALAQQHTLTTQQMFKEAFAAIAESNKQIQTQFTETLHRQEESYKAIEAEKGKTTQALQMVIASQKETIAAKEQANKSMQDALDAVMQLIQMLPLQQKIPIPTNTHQESQVSLQPEINQKNSLNNNNTISDLPQLGEKNEEISPPRSQSLEPTFTPTIPAIPKEEEKEDTHKTDDSDFEHVESSTTFETAQQEEEAPPTVAHTAATPPATVVHTRVGFFSGVASTLQSAIGMGTRNSISPTASPSVPLHASAPAEAANDADTSCVTGTPGFGSGQ